MSTSAGYRQTAIAGVFDPQRIVVLGASERRMASGNAAIRNLRQAGYGIGSLEIVHPSAATVEGMSVRRQISDLDARPDVALVSLPASALLPALRELESIGTRAAVIPSAGLDSGTQRSLEEFARSSSIALHGNNCMGILSPAGGASSWFYEGALDGVRRGGISLVSQSGSASFLTRAVEYSGFARIISTGNEIDLSSPDYLTWLATDPATSVVGLVAESIRDEEAFTAAVAALRAAGKPLVVLKVGRSERGGRATLAHTGALVSSAAAVSDYLRSLDVPQVSDYDQLAVTLQLLDGGVRAAGTRIAVITDSGGEAALTADLASEAGIELPVFTPETVERLVELVHGSPVDNPFDAGANPLTTDPEYDESYAVVALDDNVDAVMIVVEGHASVSDSEARGVDEMLGSAIRRAASTGTPVVVASSSSTATHPVLAEALGVPIVRGITNGLVAIRASAANRRPMPQPLLRPADLPDPAAVVELRERLARLGRTALDHDTARELLRAYGVGAAESHVATTEEDAVAWATGRYPVVAKVVAVDIAHRSDIGGIEVGLADEHQLRSAVRRIRERVTASRPDAVIEGIEVQAQITDSVEVLVGLTTDAALGASVVVGLGGVLVEILNDAASARVPVDAPTARGLVEATSAGRLLGGYRGLWSETPLDALVDLICRMSWLGHDLRGVVHEVDLNPVLVEQATGRLGVVDVLVSLDPPGGER